MAKVPSTLDVQNSLAMAGRDGASLALLLRKNRGGLRLPIRERYPARWLPLVSVMKTVLAFGDSLTRSARLPEERQWPALTECELRGVARLINEGLGGRTTAFDVGDDTSKNGLRVLPACLETHGPVDLLVIMLGSNDLKPDVAGTAEVAAAGMSRLVGSIDRERRQNPAMRLMLVAPPVFGPSDLPGGGPRGGRSIEESKKLAALYKELAIAVGADFADASRYATTTRRDGVHLDEDQTAKLAIGMAAEIRRVISR